jgi:ATP-dependent exoDNAse (exonuclease V) beta subunit
LTGLTVYKASAGSGKTYTLTRDYIGLVITDPECYRHILGVTFTNKATDEMKNRILDELNRLARGASPVLMDFVAREKGLSQSEVAARARIILETILHNYSRFHIETIDRFFQRAIRGFTREIGLTGGYQVELDSARLLSEAIDELLMGLDNHPELMKWFVEFARERVREGRHWNLKKDLLVLGQELSKERFQEGSTELVKQLEDRDYFNSFQQELTAICSRFENGLKEVAREAMDIIRAEGLNTGDFKGSYGVGYFFEKILRDDFRYPSDTILKSLDQPSEWHARNSGKTEQILSAYHNGVNELLRKCIKLYEDRFLRYASAGSVRGFLYALGILTDISVRIHSCAENRGIFLLSDAAGFLYGIIGGNDAPFVYEKIGNYFHHFMIDEFQDTSQLQWKNFRPLIANSLANGHRCLVVGDVKQSIYRWRNSDWEILSERLQQEFRTEQLDMQNLKQNWRSRENIIRFNNGFFTRAREIFTDHFGDKAARAYSDVDQEVPRGPGREGGYVRVNLIPDPGDGHWKDVADAQVIRTIEQLQEGGTGPSQIAILVRSKRDGKRIVDAILGYKSLHPETGHAYDVISDESLYLNNAISVRILINAFRYLVSPEDRVNLSQLVYEHCQHSGLIKESGRLPDSLFQFFNKVEPPPVPEAFLDESLRYLTLTELTERIIAIFGLNRDTSQTPYILAFQDIILEYTRGGAADVNSFLAWWEENGEEKSLAVSEDQDAIRVMTIHKAKGLEFDAVIIPYCNWSLDHRSPGPEILWCGSKQEPFNKLSLIPVRYSSSLEETIFRADYREEKFRIYMDHLNLLYVSFTRARECLFVSAPAGKEGKLANVSDLMRMVLAVGINGGKWEEEGNTWTAGEFAGKEGTSALRNQLILRSLTSHEFSGKLRLMYRGMDFFDPAAEKRVHYGNLMHEIFSRIHSSRDVQKALESVRREGLIDGQEARELGREISRMIGIDPVREWFDGSWRVIAEQDILTRGGSVRRPDRVMVREDRVIVVDYKFGEMKSPGHLSQVRHYAQMLRQMQYKEVRGFIWYVNRNEVIGV